MLKIIIISLSFLLISCQKQLIDTISRDQIEVLSTFKSSNCTKDITVFKDQETLKNYQKSINSNPRSGPLFIVDFNQYHVLAVCKENIGAYEIDSINQYKENNEIILSKISDSSAENVLLIKVPKSIEEINLKLNE